MFLPRFGILDASVDTDMPTGTLDEEPEERVASGPIVVQLQGLEKKWTDELADQVDALFQGSENLHSG